MSNQTSPNTPAHIMQIGMGFWASKTLLAAVKFKLFTHLSGTKKSAAEIKSMLQLQTTDRHVYDWLDALVSLGLLQRDGVLENGLYYNAPDTELFLDTNKPSYIGGILEMGNNRLYRYWADLEEALLTGLPQNESKHSSNMNFFTELYKDQDKLEEFMHAMQGIQTGNFMTLAQQFNFSNYKTMADVGGADGWLSIIVAQHHPNIQCTTFDLPPVEPLAKKKIAQFGLTSRITAIGGDFFNEPLPAADVITMGNIIHGMDEEHKKAIIKKVYDTLPENGVFMTIENIIDDTRNKNTFGLLMSLNMLIENGPAFDYTAADFNAWAMAAGFKKTEFISLTGPTSAAVAYK
ncbi:MAG: methyltransferase [Bacteroidetes bacterium]|nr:methyltransferase [Bacteroidota bacterium]